MQPIVIKALTKSILRILRPLVRILLRHNVSFRTFSDLAKQVYVDIASTEFGLQGRKQSISRVAILTGLSRKEVKRIQEMPCPEDTDVAERYNRAVRVAAAWRRESEFVDKEGMARVLPVTGSEGSFEALVRMYSGDLPYRAILDEMIHAGVVKRTEDGKVRLEQRAYIPSKDEGVHLHILGTDVGHLIHTIDHNLKVKTQEKRFQRKVSYDNLPAEALPVFHEMAASSGQTLLESLDKWLAENDRDTNPGAKGTGRFEAGLGVYYFQRPFSEDKKD